MVCSGGPFQRLRFCFFLGGVRSLLTELFAVAEILAEAIFYQWTLLWLFGNGLMILGLMTNFFWMTTKTASLL